MSNPAIRIGIVGFGKIARDQHLPALAADPNFELVAVTTRSPGAPAGIPGFRDMSDMLSNVPGMHAVSFCTPPQGRYALARQALEHGLHVMLEKPPCATVREIDDLTTRARNSGLALFASWHSRTAPAVDAARQWLANRTIRKMVVSWKEDVRQWHPGQRWIWQPGGLGVFDPGINALSLVTAIHPRAIFVSEAVLYFPANRDAPIAASLKLADGNDATIHAEFDFRQVGEQIWDIVVETDAGQLRLGHGGATLQIDGRAVATAPSAEYPTLYRRFADLVRTRGVDVDLAPLQLVADAFLVGCRETVDPFHD
jgi:D-galactose 1-dehydrogenase